MAAPAKGMKLLTHKVSSPRTDSWKTIEFSVLHCNNFSGNNNKFYCIEIQQLDKRYRLFSNYGRLSTSEVFEIRDKWKLTGEDILDLSEIKSEYDAIISKKKKGKKVKRANETVHEFYELIEIVSSNVGSDNIRNKITKDPTPKSPVVKSKKKGIEVSRILDQLISENIHNITSKTSLKFTDSGLSTELGLVTENHLNRAKLSLENLDKSLNKTTSPTNKNVIKFNNEFFSLIPHKFYGNLTESDMILSSDIVNEKYELLGELLTAVKLGLSSKNKTIKNDSLSVNLTISKDNELIKELSNWFDSTRHSKHSHLYTWRVKNVYIVKEPKKRRKLFEECKDKIGNIKRLFHGSRNSNILSMLINGFVVPPTSAGHVTGRMFGPGIYLASCSTKSLNYSIGYWDNSRSSKNAFMFVVDSSLGKVEKCKRFKYEGIADGYDSIHGLSVEEGGTLLNDEFVVRSPDQTELKYLLELENL